MPPYIDSIRTHLDDDLATVDEFISAYLLHRETSLVSIRYLSPAACMLNPGKRFTLASSFALSARKSTSCNAKFYCCFFFFFYLENVIQLRRNSAGKFFSHALNMHPYLPKALASVIIHYYIVCCYYSFLLY